jgi:hypothetical protein
MGQLCVRSLLAAEIASNLLFDFARVFNPRSATSTW